jgi:hypothetical protein
MRFEDLEARRFLIGSQPNIHPCNEGHELRRSQSGLRRMNHEQRFVDGISEKFTHKNHNLTARFERIIHVEWQYLESNGIFQPRGFGEWTDGEIPEAPMRLLEDGLRPLQHGGDHGFWTFHTTE